jgi:outer membrane lipoprotein SlyB
MNGKALLCAVSATCALGAAAPASAAPVTVAQASQRCGNCGVVESVRAVQRQGKPKGIAGTPVTPGMAIGGAVGGVVGNQFGHGSGRTATTLLGAAGGAYAGHAIENRRERYTAYVLRVRMHDGTYRTVEQRQPVARGAHVVIENHTAHLISPHPAHG